MVVDFVRREIADVLRTSPKRLPLDRPLNQLGLDSLTAIELLARVESQLGAALPMQQLANAPTLEGLADRLADHVARTGRPARELNGGEPPPLLGR